MLLLLLFFLAALGALFYYVRRLHQAQVAEVKRVRFSSSGGKSVGRRIAVVGAGPGGLSSTYFLLQHGLEPVVFEAEVRREALFSPPSLLLPLSPC
jgi:NADPH-dependent 2,4-dienoyl-CoA reductase/sulfur reductase-like enzyme